MEKPFENRELSIRKIEDAAKYCSRIDPSEVSPETLDDVLENNELCHAIFCGDEIVGIALIDNEDESRFLLVYIFKEFRNRGLGLAAARLAERIMYKSNMREIVTEFRESNEGSRRFAEKCGFKERFASALMEYEGKAFETQELTIRRYEDEDYIEAFTLTDEAFHLMRLSTGCFPDSKRSEPSEKSQEYWRKTADERLVCLLDGEIVGAAKLDGAELDMVAIKPTMQGRGLGKAFVKYLVNLMLEKEDEKPCLWCVVGNDKARRLYDSLGFKEEFVQSFAYKNIDADNKK